MNNLCWGFGCMSTKLACAAELLGTSGLRTARGQIAIPHKAPLKQQIPLPCSCHHCRSTPDAVALVSCSQTPSGGRGCMHLWPSPTKQTTQERIPLQPTGFDKRQSAALCGPAARSPGSLELNVPVILPGGSSGSWIQAITIKSGHS